MVRQILLKNRYMDKENRIMSLGKLGEQIVLKSKKAFDTIEFLSFEMADNSEYYLKRKARDEQARKDFMKMLWKPWERPWITLQISVTWIWISFWKCS